MLIQFVVDEFFQEIVLILVLLTKISVPTSFMKIKKNSESHRE